MTKTEKLSHYSVVLIAVLAVVISIWQVRISQEHNRLSVRPYMDFFYGWATQDIWQLTLSNEGVGPAIIKEVKFFFKGKEYERWGDVLKAAHLYERRTNSYTFTGDTPFAVQKQVHFLELNTKDLQLNTVGIKVLIHYESIYKEKFQLEINF